jgi:hypothetical protein
MSDREVLPDLYVLDALANDIESLEDVLRMLNSDTVLGWHRTWGRPFQRAEIVESLARLIKEESVRAHVLTPDGKGLDPLPPRTLPSATFDDVWFEMTPHGRMRHANWEPKLEGA